MPRYYPTDTDTDVTVTTTTETAVITSQNLTTGSQGDQIALTASCDLTSGTGATTATLRLRRGSGTSGTAIATSDAIDLTAADTTTLAIAATDSPGEVVDATYTLTIAIADATADSTVGRAFISAHVGT